MRARPFDLRPATADDAEWFAPRLRSADLLEVDAFFADHAEGLRQSIAMSEITAVAHLNGRGVILLGCASHERDGEAAPWLVATGEVIRYPGALTRIGRHYVSVFLERWPLLWNFVDERNLVSARWLERLGFSLGEPVEIGRNGERFRPFVMRA